jgi:hypothetical protein
MAKKKRTANKRLSEGGDEEAAEGEHAEECYPDHSSSEVQEAEDEEFNWRDFLMNGGG